METRRRNEFEERLARYLFERSEEARAVRVGEKETSEQAAIVARYADLFTREQHAALREAEEGGDDERERLFRLREACGGGVVVRELAEEADRLENDILACRIDVRRRGAAAPDGPGQAGCPRRLRRARRARHARGATPPPFNDGGSTWRGAQRSSTPS